MIGEYSDKDIARRHMLLARQAYSPLEGTQVEVGDHQRKANFSEHREYSPVFLLPWRGARRAPRAAGASSPSRDRQPAAWSLACRILSAARSAPTSHPYICDNAPGVMRRISIPYD
jgi:hypothetical protein